MWLPINIRLVNIQKLVAILARRFYHLSQTCSWLADCATREWVTCGRGLDSPAALWLARGTPRGGAFSQSAPIVFVPAGVSARFFFYAAVITWTFAHIISVISGHCLVCLCVWYFYDRLPNHKGVNHEDTWSQLCCFMSLWALILSVCDITCLIWP